LTNATHQKNAHSTVPKTLHTTQTGTWVSNPIFAAFQSWRAKRARDAARRAVFRRTLAEMAAMSPAERAEFGFTKQAIEHLAWDKAYTEVPG
jgi:hypothetical protein